MRLRWWMGALLALLAVVLSSCAPLEAPRPAGEEPVEAPAAPEAPEEAEPAEEPAAEEAEEPTARGRVILVKGDAVELHDLESNASTRLPTAGQSEVILLEDQLLVVDGQQAMLVGPDGSLKSQPMPAAGPGSVTMVGQRVVASHDGWAAIYDTAGQSLANVDTRGLARVAGDDNRLLFLDNGLVTAVDSSGSPLFSVAVQGQPEVWLVGERLVLADEEQVRIFDWGGAQMGQAVPLAGPAQVVVAGERLVVPGPGFVGLYDLSGWPIMNVDVVGTPHIESLEGGLLLADERSIRVLSHDGELLSQAIPISGAGELVVEGDRFVVVEEGWTAFYDLAGAPMANIGTAGRALATFMAGQIVLTDKNSVRVFTADGTQVSQNIPVGTDGEVTVEGGWIAVAHDGWVAVYDMAGSVQANIEATARADVRVLDGQIVLFDQNNVRVFAPQGSQLGSAIPARGTNELLVTP